MDYEAMSIEQLEAEGNRVEDIIAGLRKESRARAAVLDRKVKLQPIIATPNDQVLHPGGPDIVTQLKGLPAAMFEQAKAFFTNGGK